MFKHDNLSSVAPNSNTLNNSSTCLKADTGASKNFVRDTDVSFLTKVNSLQHGPIAKLPNNNTIQAKRQGLLPFSKHLSTAATSALVFPDLKNSSLLSIGQLCDDNCLAIFGKHDLEVIKDNNIILRGKRNFQDGLWDVPFDQSFAETASQFSTLHIPTTSKFASVLPSCNNISSVSYKNEQQNILSCNYILTLDKSNYELAQYLYGCLYAPSISTLETAIHKRNLISWPGIKTINFKKYVGKNIAHEKGHLDQERQNLRSTQNKSVSTTTVQDKLEGAFPSVKEPKCHHCYAVVIPYDKKGITYSDQTGRFPYQSS